MVDLILDTSRFNSLFDDVPTHADTGNTGANDDLSTDQSPFSYGFDFKGIHFAMLDTDPGGNDTHATTK